MTSVPTTRLPYPPPELPVTLDTNRILTLSHHILRRTNALVKKDLIASQSTVVHQLNTTPTPSKADTAHTPNTLRLRANPRSSQPVWLLITTVGPTRPVLVTMKDNTKSLILTLTGLDITKHQ